MMDLRKTGVKFLQNILIIWREFESDFKKLNLKPIWHDVIIAFFLFNILKFFVCLFLFVCLILFIVFSINAAFNIWNNCVSSKIKF